MKKLPLIILATALILPAESFGQRTSDRTSANDPRLEQWLKKYPDSDADKNGVLTLAEAKAYQQKLRERRVEGKKKPRVPPTHADVKYGEHERQVFDVWIPETGEKPFPILVFFHGGGFVAGDKAGFDPAPYLERGIAAASGNYRFVDGHTTFAPTPMEDAARVIQTIRHRSKEWGLDTDRIAVSGGSAGAVITMWIGYRDDLADPDSDDPVARQSTRVHTIVPLNGPTNIDPIWIRENMGGPHHVHGSLPKMFGRSPSDQFDEPEIRKRIEESNPWGFLTKDDPPTLMIYGGGMDEMPLPENTSTGKLIHHPFFGKKLKERLDELEIENGFYHATDPRGKPMIADYLQERFGME